MSTPPSSRPPQNPLDRLTSGGWVKGSLRLGIGVVLVGVVLSVAGRESWDRLNDPRLLPVVLGGALVHLVQRVARIRKWQLMLAPVSVKQRSFGHLLRIQLIGMVANLIVPVSEALKVWAVSSTRSDAKVAAKSIVIDMAMHTSLIGMLGLGALVMVGQTPNVAIATVGLIMALGPLVVIAVGRRWPTSEPPTARVVDARWDVWGLAAVETACQASIYALAFGAIGVDFEVVAVLALAPVLYIVDLLNFTPSGLGLREALFAGVLDVLPNASADIGVATGILISSMLLAATLLGGGVALLLPDRQASDSSLSADGRSPNEDELGT